MSANNKKQGSTMLPGLEGFIKQKEEEWFWDGQKNEHYFDAMDLPDIPARQMNAQGAQTYVMYVIFPSFDELVRAIHAFTHGKRKGLAPGSKTASINGAHKPDGGEQTFLELWEQALLPKEKPSKKKKVNTDEAQAPIE